MRRSVLTSVGLALSLVLTACSGQPPAESPSPVRSETSAPPPRPTYTEADVAFMTGMIPHHTQAIRISAWAPTHGAGAELQRMAERIIVSQRDEIHLMQRWLREKGLPVPAMDTAAAHHHGSDHAMMMPGMLTPAQLTQLDQARGEEFDQLFLLYMIQHHQGALTMIHDLGNSPGAAQTDDVFKLISDMNADQLTEIERMKTMLVRMAGAAEE